MSTFSAEVWDPRLVGNNNGVNASSSNSRSASNGSMLGLGSAGALANSQASSMYNSQVETPHRSASAEFRPNNPHTALPPPTSSGDKEMPARLSPSTSSYCAQFIIIGKEVKKITQSPITSRDKLASEDKTGTAGGFFSLPRSISNLKLNLAALNFDTNNNQHNSSSSSLNLSVSSLNNSYNAAGSPAGLEVPSESLDDHRKFWRKWKGKSATGSSKSLEELRQKYDRENINTHSAINAGGAVVNSGDRSGGSSSTSTEPTPASATIFLSLSRASSHGRMNLVGGAAAGVSSSDDSAILKRGDSFNRDHLEQFDAAWSDDDDEDRGGVSVLSGENGSSRSGAGKRTKIVLGPGLPSRKKKPLIQRLFQHSDEIFINHSDLLSSNQRSPSEESDFNIDATPEEEEAPTPVIELLHYPGSAVSDHVLPEGGGAGGEPSLSSKHGKTTSPLYHHNHHQHNHHHHHGLFHLPYLSSNKNHSRSRSSSNNLLSKIFHMHHHIDTAHNLNIPNTTTSESPASPTSTTSSHSDLHAQTSLPHPLSEKRFSPSSDSLNWSSSMSNLRGHFHLFSNKRASSNENDSSLLKDSIISRTRRSQTVNENSTTISTSESSSATNTPHLPTPPRGLQRSMSEVDKYGKIDEILGKGANAVVRLAHQKSDLRNPEKLYAIKEFRKKRKNESSRDYVKKLMSEFCISSSLHHENVVEAIDLLQDENSKWCEVMEYMAGGDLYNRISKGTLSNIEEISCYFKQLVNGVAYMHSMGVAHRDLKPENLMLNDNGRILKITDFGCSEVFKTCFEKNARTTKGLYGSDPYIAPEEWEEDAQYDAVKVDIWACGIILYTMCQKTVPWALAKPSDPHYSVYIQKRHDEGYGFSQFDRLPQGPKSVIYQMMQSDPDKRWNTEELLKQPYMANIEYCHTETSVTPSERKPGTSSGGGSSTDSGSIPTSPTEARKCELPDPPIIKLNTLNNVRHVHPLPSPSP